jgi:uncharacterized protein with PQ loop repeat
MNSIKIIPAIGLLKKLKGMGIINFAFFIITHFAFLIFIKYSIKRKSKSESISRLFSLPIS